MLNPGQQVKLRWAIVGTILVVVFIGRVAQAQEHWSEAANPQLAACDLIYDTEGYEAGAYCLARYQAAAGGIWTDSGGPEFAQALPMLGLFLVAGLGLTIGSAVYPR